MSEILYNIGLQAYRAGLRLAAPFHPKAAQWVKGREGILQKMEQRLKGNEAPVAWFHCASVGEFEQGRPLMEGFKAKFPEFKILLTFFSPSGYELRKNYPLADYIFYLPLDTEKNARCFVKLAKPKIAIFIKYEFWHHYTRALRKRHIPLISVSAVFRPNQIFFNKRGSFYRHILDRFSHIYTQNQESALLLSSINFTKASTVGDTRVDRVLQNARQAGPIPVAEAFVDSSPTMVIGSSWPEDMKILRPFMQQRLGQLKFIIAPHEIKESELQDLEKAFTGQTLRFSKATPENAPSARVLLIDNIGMLSKLYQYATYAYVGGAFGKGLHNTLEPAAFGPPIFFGTKYDKFQEATDLIAAGVAFSVKSAKDLEKQFSLLHQDPEKRAEVKAAALAYLQKQAGATERILTALEYWLPSRQE